MSCHIFELETGAVQLVATNMAAFLLSPGALLLKPMFDMCRKLLAVSGDVVQEECHKMDKIITL